MNIDYCKTQNVSFSVAEKLKYLQYSEETLDHYLYNGAEVKKTSFGSPKRALKIQEYETFCAPTQGYILRELRDKHNLSVCTNPVKTENKKIKYQYTIYDVDESFEGPWIIKDNTIVDELFDTQEDAIDAGILNALQYIEKW